MKIRLIIFGLLISMTGLSQIDTVNTGSGPGAGNGEVLYTAFQKVNEAIKSINRSGGYQYVIPISDEESFLSTGADKYQFRIPHDMTITEVRASVNEAATGDTIFVDILESGTSLFSTQINIDPSETTSTTAGLPYVFIDSVLTDNAVISFDISRIGSTLAGKGLKISITGE